MLVTLLANFTVGFGIPEEWGSSKFAEVDALLSSVGPNR
jgi:hypothetical protein